MVLPTILLIIISKNVDFLTKKTEVTCDKNGETLRMESECAQSVGISGLKTGKTSITYQLVQFSVPKPNWISWTSLCQSSKVTTNSLNRRVPPGEAWHGNPRKLGYDPYINYGWWIMKHVCCPHQIENKVFYGLIMHNGICIKNNINQQYETKILYKYLTILYGT